MMDPKAIWLLLRAKYRDFVVRSREHQDKERERATRDSRALFDAAMKGDNNRVRKHDMIKTLCRVVARKKGDYDDRDDDGSLIVVRVMMAMMRDRPRCDPTAEAGWGVTALNRCGTCWGVGWPTCGTASPRTRSRSGYSPFGNPPRSLSSWARWGWSLIQVVTWRLDPRQLATGRIACGERAVGWAREISE
jgi:hypothetical protein